MTSKFFEPVHDIFYPLYDMAFHRGLSPESVTRTSRNKVMGILFLAKTPRTPKLKYPFNPCEKAIFAQKAGLGTNHLDSYGVF